MSKRLHSSLILAAVFVLGIVGGVAGMVWAWPGLRARYFHHERPPFIEYLQKSLNLTPAQVPRMQAIFKETGDRSHAIHVQFMPQYSNLCEQYVQVRAQEREAYAPVRQEELDKIQAVLNPTQWATFQKQRSAAMQAQSQRQQHDPCQHPDQGPGGGGRGGRGGRRGPPPSQ